MARSSANIPSAVAPAALLLAASVLFSLSSSPSGAADACSRYRSAEHFLSLANAALSKHELREAEHDIDDGISLLGHPHVDAAFIDDSEPALSAARDMEGRGELLAAVKTKQGVLTTRLLQYARANACPAK